MKPAPTEPDPQVVTAMEERTHSRLQVAPELPDHGHYDDAVSRAYCAVFHAATVLFYCGGRVFASHAQLVGAFNKEFVSTHLLPEETARTPRDLFELRQSAEYDATGTVEEAEAGKTLYRAEHFINRLIDYARETYPSLFQISE